MNQEALRLLIRRKLADGGLPHNSIPRIWGGPANGEVCNACEGIIDNTRFIMEGISAHSNRGIQLHVECFYVWDEERDAPGR